MSAMSRAYAFFGLLKSLSALLAKWTPLFVALAAVESHFFPSTFAWVRGDAQTAVLGVIMLAMGMTLKGDDFRVLASRPMDMAIGAAAQFALMPAIAWALVHVFALPKSVGVGLLLVGCCPGGVSSNIMSFLCRGDVAFSVGMTTLSTLLAPLLTPLLMRHLSGENVDVDMWGMFRSMLQVTIIPVAAGFLANTLFGKKAAYREALSVMPGVAVAGLACIVGGVVSAHGARFLESGLVIFACVALHNGLGYALGFAAGAAAGFSKAKRRTISIEVGMQNAGLATVLAGKHFPAMPEAAVASAVSCVWHSVSGAILAGLFNAADALRAKKRR